LISTSAFVVFYLTLYIDVIIAILLLLRYLMHSAVSASVMMVYLSV